jgi:hypothetical protein
MDDFEWNNILDFQPIGTGDSLFPIAKSKLGKSNANNQCKSIWGLHPFNSVLIPEKGYPRLTTEQMFYIIIMK